MRNMTAGRVYADILTPDFSLVCKAVGLPHQRIAKISRLRRRTRSRARGVRALHDRDRHGRDRPVQPEFCRSACRRGRPADIRGLAMSAEVAMLELPAEDESSRVTHDAGNNSG